jgi:predicted acetyltransferase
MAYLIPCTYHSKGQDYKAGYFYAAATHPDHRGRGYMASLIQSVKQVATERGMDLIFLVPAEPGLFTYYENFGFQPALYHKTLQFTAQELQEVLPAKLTFAADVTAEAAMPDRLQQREQALQGTDHLSYTKEQLQYFFYSQLVSGGHVAVAKDGYAFYEKKDTTVMVTEWISTESDSKLPAVLLEEAADTYQFRLPVSATVFPGKETSPEADGMACALTERGAQAMEEKDYPYIGFPLS